MKTDTSKTRTFLYLIRRNTEVLISLPAIAYLDYVTVFHPRLNPSHLQLVFSQ